MKHRKLFPTSTTNQSMVCPDACDPTCPDGCYPFSDYFFPPPLPPPPSPPPSISAKRVVSVSPYVAIIATLLGVALLIITYYLVVVKNCAGWGCFRPRRRQQEGNEEGFLDENNGVGIDHPIWYIRTIGLQPSVIDSITVFKYKKGDSLIEGTDCSVCLNEFQDDEILRLLPKCSHAFHIPCIDNWLRSHTNCPVCRAGIVSNAVAATPVAPDEDNQGEITDDDGSQNNQARSVGEVEDGVEFPENAENAASWVIDDLEENNKVKNAMHQVKRSVSADSLMIAKIRLAVESLSMAEFEAPELNGPNKSGMHQRTNDATIAQPSNQKDFTVKRSVSYGGRSFLSRNSGNPNSILIP